MRPDPAQRALFIVLLASLAVVAMVLWPLFQALLIAAVAAAVLAPSHRWLTLRMGGRRSLAATLLLLAVLLVVVIPVAALSTFVVQQTVGAAAFVSDTLRSEGVEGLLRTVPEPVADVARRAIGALTEGARGVSLGQGGAAAAAFGSAVAATGSVVFHTVMMLIALFFFLTLGDDAVDWVDDASPLEHQQTRELLGEVRRVAVAVVRSTVLTAGVQTLAAMVGYYIAGVPYPWFFGGVTFFMALIPAIGAAVVCLATAAIVFATGHTWAAVFLAIWGLVVVGLADNLVKPLLMRHGVGLHGAVVFFSLIGGLAAFGAIGLVAGPLAVAFFVAVLRIWRRDYGDGGVPGAEPVADPLPTAPTPD